jgi:hypothetical protein
MWPVIIWGGTILRGGPWAKKIYGVFDRALDAETTGNVSRHALRPVTCTQGTMTLAGLGDRLGIVRGDTTEESLAFEKVTILVGNPIANGVSACQPTMLPGKNFWGNTAFVRTVWASAMTKEGKDDLGVTVGGGKVERC